MEKPNRTIFYDSAFIKKCAIRVFHLFLYEHNNLYSQSYIKLDPVVLERKMENVKI